MNPEFTLRQMGQGRGRGGRTNRGRGAVMEWSDTKICNSYRLFKIDPENNQCLMDLI